MERDVVTPSLEAVHQHLKCGRRPHHGPFGWLCLRTSSRPSPWGPNGNAAEAEPDQAPSFTVNVHLKNVRGCESRQPAGATVRCTIVMASRMPVGSRIRL